MNITAAGLALIVLVILFVKAARSGIGPVGVFLAAMSGAAVSFFGAAAVLAWDLGTSLAGVANDLANTGLG